jgi:hypothetical protein
MKVKTGSTSEKCLVVQFSYVGKSRKEYREYYNYLKAVAKEPAGRYALLFLSRKNAEPFKIIQ